MTGSAANSIHTRIGINASCMIRYRYPRYCPMCLEENNIEPYWARLPQTDIIICPKHNCFIKSYTPTVEELNRSLFIAATYNRVKFESPQFNLSSSLLSLAKKYARILNGDYEFDINKVDYGERIRNGGYPSQHRLNMPKLIADFKRYYGNQTLAKVFPNYKDDSSYEWLRTIIKRPSHIFHPVKHILFNEFTLSIHPLIPTKEEPFGIGPWLCLNKTCSHYNKKVIPNFISHIESKTKRLIGIFTCSCGMIYTRSLITKDGKPKEFVRIKEWGFIWKKRLEQELSTGKSFRIIASILGTDAKTISNYATSINPINSKVKDIKDQLESHRAKWKELLDKFDRYKVNSARKDQPGTYAWLYKNDKSWLMTINKLYSYNAPLSQLRLDWKQLDEVILNKISVTINELKKEGFKGRVTRTLIAKILNHEKYLLGANIKRLPQSRHFLSTICESRDEYQIKRLRRVNDQLTERLEMPARWKLMKKAGLRKDMSPSVEAEIKRILKYGS